MKVLVYLGLGFLDFFLAALLVKVTWNLTMPHAFPQLPAFSWAQAFVVSFILTTFKGTKDMPEKYEDDMMGYVVHCLAEKIGFICIGIPIAFVLNLCIT